MRVTPPLEEVLGHVGDETHVAVSVEVVSDLETPISLYLKIAREGAYSFLLESAEGGETIGRYSFIGFDPERVFTFKDGSGTILSAPAKDRAGGNQGEAPPSAFTSQSVTFSDPLLIIRDLLQRYRVTTRSDLPRFQGGIVGYLGFDCVKYFESVPLPGNESAGSESDVPEGVVMLCSRLVIVDHLRHRIMLVDYVPLSGDRQAAYEAAKTRLSRVIERLKSPAEAPPLLLTERPAPTPTERPTASPATDGPLSVEGLDVPPNATTNVNMPRAAYEEAVEKAREAIRAGEIFQVVLSQRFSVHEHVPPFTIYRALRATNPSPYMFHLNFGDWAVVGASPEVLVRLDRGEILLRPIAGTRRRGENAAEDLALEKELLQDAKELAEHRMLVDLGRNDVGRVAAIGSVSVERLLHIERFSHVMHIVSDIRGELREGLDAFDVFRACFPAGTVSGAPKVRAMEVIAKLEPTRRGVYSGAVGYFDFTGNMDTCIAIRTLVVRPGRIDVQVGAGIVADSNPASEYIECTNKGRACITALAMAELSEAEGPKA